MSADGSTAGPEPQPRRKLWPRIGITLLNLLAPGLGLLRVGRLLPALVLLVAPILLIASLILLFRLLPDLGLGGFLTIVIGGLALQLAIYGTAMVLSWRASRDVRLPLPWYARWYVLAIVAVADFAAWFVLTEDRDRFGYRSFSVPSESMAPTLIPGDTFVARMRAPDELRRGQIVLHDVRGNLFSQRIVALPGDRIGMRNGKIVLNGVEIAQIPTGREDRDSAGYGMLREYQEQLPGEARPHLVYDSERVSEADEYAEVVVPPDHIFLLGDNRDNSADSRFSGEDFGVGFVRISAIRGYPLFHLWPGGSQPSGTAIHD